jgi:ABC-type polar amino acid transport system ATPase subunit
MNTEQGFDFYETANRKSINIERFSTIEDTTRNNYVKKLFDIDMIESKNEYHINFDLDQKSWNVGLIIGSSGSGKSTIAKEIEKIYDFKYFSSNEWNNNSIIDNFSEDISIENITEILSKVGFNSVTDWLKSYNKLSNGQKFRCDLARAVAESEKTLIFDEFTSVVDRNVAKIASSSIEKFVRKNDKSFVAVSCHYDILEWLQPDWVIDIDKNEFYWRSPHRRPELELNIRVAKYHEWQIFKKHHYLSSDLLKSADLYVGEINNQICSFCAVSHFPHSKVANFKKIHRIVVLPDYQGIGLGKKFLNAISEIYYEKNFRVIITTSAPAFTNSLDNDLCWKMTRKPSFVSESKGCMKGKTSTNRLTASFEYNYDNRNILEKKETLQTALF